MPELTTNTLFYGDNLPILREHVDTESVDLVYLDPPFNSNRSFVREQQDDGSDVEFPARSLADKEEK
jgi:site-specific DNA-methyltransferase (adenine-specific)